MSQFWIFGYGSLMWNPGFATLTAARATMHGVHRSLCVHSWVHRGSQQRPGLVLGLDRGGSCHGMAFAVAPSDRDAVVAYLRERELVTNVYVEAIRSVRLDTGERVEALVYLVDRAHPQYAGKLDDRRIAAIVKEAQGKSGANVDYVANTLAHLRRMGIRDPHLEAVAASLAAVQAPV